MKLTQTIKNWLHKMFSWWPWKQPTQFEYSKAANPLNTGKIQDTLSRSTIDGIVPQAGIIPRLSTIEEWPERVVQSDFPGTNEFAETSSILSAPSGDSDSITTSPAPADESFLEAQISPSPQQRLEFLRYLIKRGIVNEGTEREL